MIRSVRVTSHLGESVLLTLRSPEQSGFFIYSITGLGPPKANINIREVLTMDGGIYNSARATFRNIVFNLGYWDETLSAEDIRQESYKYFPLKKPISIEIITDNRVCKTSGYVESNEPNIFSSKESTVISVICPDSYFFSGRVTEIIMSRVDSSFEFPFENPSLIAKLIEFGDLLSGTREHGITNPGDVTVGAIFYIDFTGSGSDPTIFNHATSETMTILSSKIIDIVGSDFTYGDRLIISTVKESKSVTLIRDEVPINVLGAFDMTGEWVQIDAGYNLLEVSATSGIDNMIFTAVFDIEYGGI